LKVKLVDVLAEKKFQFCIQNINKYKKQDDTELNYKTFYSNSQFCLIANIRHPSLIFEGKVGSDRHRQAQPPNIN